MQAHHNAQHHAEEFVVELLVSLDRMHVLVHDLLAIEVSPGPHACAAARPAGLIEVSPAQC